MHFWHSGKLETFRIQGQSPSKAPRPHSRDQVRPCQWWQQESNRRIRQRNLHGRWAYFHQLQRLRGFPVGCWYHHWPDRYDRAHDQNQLLKGRWRGKAVPWSVAVPRLLDESSRIRRANHKLPQQTKKLYRKLDQSFERTSFRRQLAPQLQTLTPTTTMIILILWS